MGNFDRQSCRGRGRGTRGQDQCAMEAEYLRLGQLDDRVACPDSSIVRRVVVPPLATRIIRLANDAPGNSIKDAVYAEHICGIVDE